MGDVQIHQVCTGSLGNKFFYYQDTTVRSFLFLLSTTRLRTFFWPVAGFAFHSNVEASIDRSVSKKRPVRIKMHIQLHIQNIELTTNCTRTSLVASVRAHSLLGLSTVWYLQPRWLLLVPFVIFCCRRRCWFCLHIGLHIEHWLVGQGLALLWRRSRCLL